MTFPELIDPTKRHDAAVSLFVWIKIRSARRRDAHNPSRIVELQELDATSALLCKAQMQGYREALHDMFG